MKNYNVSDEPVTEVAVDINDIKDTCNEKGRNEECVFLVAGRMIYRKGLDFLFDALMRIPQETRYQKENPDRKSTRLNSSHSTQSRMPSSA